MNGQEMNKEKDSRSIKLELIGLLGVIAVSLIFATLRAHYSPSDENERKSLAAYPSPVLTAAPTIIPANPLISTRSPETEPSVTPTQVVLENGWYLYTDPDSEFSFAYPQTAHIDAGRNPVDSSKNIIIQFQLPDKPYQGMSIRMEANPKMLSGVDIARQLFETSAQAQAPAEFINSAKSTTAGNLPAIEVSIPSMNTETTIIVPVEDKVFILSPVHDSANNMVEKEILELFYKILSTFDFNVSK